MTLQGAGGPGAYGYYPAPTVKTSTKGPKIITFSGIPLVVVAIAIVLLVLLPAASARSVLASDGSPGAVVTLAVDAPGEGVLEFGPAQTQQVFLAYPSGGPVPELSGEILVQGPLGYSQPVMPFGAEQASTGGVSAHLAGVFNTLAPGEYRIEVPATVDGSAVTVLVRPAITLHDSVGEAVLAAIAEPAAIFLGVLGAVIVVGGGLWWRQRAAARRRVAGGTAAGPNGPAGGAVRDAQRSNGFG